MDYYLTYNIYKYIIIQGVQNMADYKGRCMKCKKEVAIKDAKIVTMKNKMNAAKGTCPTCGTKVFRIIGKAK